MNSAVLIICIVVIDQITKYLVAGGIWPNRVIIPGFFEITYLKNTGMAWSMLSGQQAFLCVVAAVAIGFMLYYLLFKKPTGLLRIAVSLMMAGATGNLIDRLFLNYVRDFLNFYIFGYDFPVFNVADSALTIGVILIFIASMKEDKKNA